MTEGIIQKVFKPYIISQITGTLRTNVGVDDIIRLEQELIKEITEQAIRPLPGMRYIYLHKLIGDTKE